MRCAFCLCRVDRGHMSSDGMLFCDECAALTLHQCDDCGDMLDQGDLDICTIDGVAYCPECDGADSFVGVDL